MISNLTIYLYIGVKNGMRRRSHAISNISDGDYIVAINIGSFRSTDKVRRYDVKS